MYERIPELWQDHKPPITLWLVERPSMTDAGMARAFGISRRTLVHNLAAVRARLTRNCHTGALEGDAAATAPPLPSRYPPEGSRRDRRGERLAVTEGRFAVLGKLHPDEVEAVLHRQHVGRLACIADGRPYIVPITFAYAGGELYGRTLPGRKLSALRTNPRVCVEIDERDGPGDWCSVVADGIYEEVTNPAERRAAMALLADLDPAALPEPAAVSGVVFRLRLGEKGGRFVRPEPAPSLNWGWR